MGTEATTGETDEPVVPVRRRVFTPACERTERMHQWTARLRAAVGEATAGGVDGVRLGTLSAREAGECLLELREVRARLQGLERVLLAHADVHAVARTETGEPDTAGQAPRSIAADTAGWLATVGLVPATTARHEMRAARELSEPFRLTGSALLAGDIDAEQAESISWALRRLPDPDDHDDLALLERAERAMLRHARTLDAAQLKRLGRRLHELLDPEGADAAEDTRLRREEELAAARVSFTTHDTGDGTTQVSATIATRHAEMLRKALHAIANPALADAVTREKVIADPTGTRAPVTHRRPDARVMGEAFTRLLESVTGDQLPSTGGTGAVVLVTMDLDTLLDDLGHGGSVTTPDPWRRDTTGAAGPQPSGPGRSAPARAGRTRQRRSRPATLDTGARISAQEARRLACEASIIPVVLGGDSEVLDLGRARRLHTTAQRRAMAVRQDHRCAAEGCDRPAAWCEAHHLTPWSVGGATDLDDGALLCQRHHTLVHDPAYEVHRRPGHSIVIVRRVTSTVRRT